MASLLDPRDLKLERVLEFLDRAQPGLAAQLVSVAVDTKPNQLHRYIASLLRRGRVSVAVTLNFDELIERTRGRPLRVWTTGDPVAGDAEVLHVHGRAGEPGSLRHILARFAVRLPDQEHQYVSSALSGEVVTLGWAATDPDILAALREGAGEVHALIAGDVPDTVTRESLIEVAEYRRVTLYRGGLAAFSIGGGARYSPPSSSTFRRSIDAVVSKASSLSEPLARRAYVGLHFEHAIAHGSDHTRLLESWKGVATSDPHEQTLLSLARAELHQASGQSARAALINYRIFRTTGNPHYLSEVGDALERSLRGLNPLKGLIGFLIHRRVMSLYQRQGIVAPLWARARLARASMRVGRVASAGGLLDQLLFEIAQGPDQDLWVHGHLLRLRALSRAKARESSWRADLDSADRLFRFSARPLEQGSVLRAAALCELIEGAAGWRARAVETLEKVRDFYTASPDASAPMMLLAQRTVTLWIPRRAAIWILLRL